MLLGCLFKCSSFKDASYTQKSIQVSQTALKQAFYDFKRYQSGSGQNKPEQQTRQLPPRQQQQEFVDPNDLQFYPVASIKKMMYHDVCLNNEQAERALRVRRRIKPSVWTRYFFERRKVQAIYCLTRTQLRILVGLALSRHGRAGENLIALLERRLDVVLWRSMLVPTIYAARNAIMLRQVRLNGQLAIRAGYLCWPGDVIQLAYDHAPSMLNFLSVKDRVDNSIGLNAQVTQGHPNWIRNNALIARMMMVQKPQHKPKKMKTERQRKTQAQLATEKDPDT
eukprot:TRINITY_DN4963_c0_g2_i1.p1 TRINITY_DN4963_c0_g2~~TRINITY_DN4963_c0_g2_i1.p1  ORF type:complete len:289 (+),score=9.76 TRINITY_DN4963_c0_g2_i1:27-869(+)